MLWCLSLDFRKRRCFVYWVVCVLNDVVWVWVVVKKEDIIMRAKALYVKDFFQVD